MKLEINIKNTENIGELSSEQMSGITEIVTALVQSGGLTGIKGGQTILHFDSDGIFQKVELKYYPWQRRRT